MRTEPGEKTSPFVSDKLGKWSSHPKMLPGQKRMFFLLGFIPVVFSAVVILLMLTNYRASDFAGVRDWPTFLAAAGVVWDRIGTAVEFLVCGAAVTFGFAFTLNILWMVSMTMARVGRGSRESRDSLPFPSWLVFVFCFFWLAPLVLALFRESVMAVDWRLYLIAQLLSNLFCFLPFAALLCWTACVGRDRECGPGEVKKHPWTQLLSAVLMFAAGAAVMCIPEPEFFRKLIESEFPWIANSGVKVSRIFRYVRLVLSSVLFGIGFVNMLLWRLVTVIKKKKPVGETAEASAAEEEGEEDGVPECAEYLVEHLPEGIELDGEVSKVEFSDSSPYVNLGSDTYGLKFLTGGLTPTKDQFEFFDRFVKSYETSRNGFMENEDPSASFMKADILLQGEEGSGRTEIMLAAAVYAAAARGQRVLYIVPGREYAKLLACRINDRFGDLMVDCYFSADCLSQTDIESWIAGDSGKIPPDILFATPESVERAFFSNSILADPGKRESVRAVMLDYNVIFVDDFLEQSLASRSHCAFLLDKFRLLMAGECVLPQFVVAVSPLYAPDAVEQIGARLFGFGQFNRNSNVFRLRPRPCDPYWYGTLRVRHGGDAAAEGLTLEEASLRLLRTSLNGNFKTLLYRKGMSNPEKTKINEDFREAVNGGGLRVVSHIYELADVNPRQDNVFYLSLACGNAGAALRLNLNGAEDSTPVFFRIATEEEGSDEAKDSFALLPDETALPLRAHHLRSVLQYIPRLTPIESKIWARFGISRNHPCLREADPQEDLGSRVAVQWYHDELVEEDRYTNGQIWPYLVLATASAANNRGEKVDFNLLPNARECIWIDRRSAGVAANRLILARSQDDRGEGRRQLVVWRDAQGESQGETDLAHADELVCVHSGDSGAGAGSEEYTAAGIIESKGADRNRYAMTVKAQYRRGTDSDYLYPIRRLTWNVPSAGLDVPSVRALEEIAGFQVERKEGVACRVNGVVTGLLNMRAESMKVLPSREYAYDAYLSCMVLLPTLPESGEDADGTGPEDYVRECVSGTWRTDASFGFSCLLTHAFTIAFRRRLSGWSFFTTAPVFYTEGREGSVGQVTVWFVEPSNSGRTVYPVVERLMAENHAFRTEIFRTVKEIVTGVKSLTELRMASRMAFADEKFSEDDRSKALKIVEQLLSSEKRAEEAASRAAGEERRKRSAGSVHHRESDDYTDEEREFDETVVNALMAFEETIDVTRFASGYGWDCDRISDLFIDVLWNNPQVFFVAKRGRYQWWSDSTGKVTRFVITDLVYGIGKDEYDERKSELDVRVAEAMKTLDGVADPVEKAKLLHDHIVSVCEYDEEARDTHDLSPAARTVYSVLVRRKAVCEGYTMAYRYLLREAGIRSEEVVSDKMRHCWNYVKIGDSWYHVDVTWDDPVYIGCRPANAGISREYFLLSDAGIRKKKHYAWNVRGLPPASDTKYDAADWG